MKNTYTINYEPHSMNGSPGYWFKVKVRGREVAAGWEPGKKHRAEIAAREAINARDTLRGLSGLT